jgi:hypothetical protein
MAAALLFFVFPSKLMRYRLVKISFASTTATDTRTRYYPEGSFPQPGGEPRLSLDVSSPSPASVAACSKLVKVLDCIPPPHKPLCCNLQPGHPSLFCSIWKYYNSRSCPPFLPSLFHPAGDINVSQSLFSHTRGTGGSASRAAQKTVRRILPRFLLAI